MDYNGLNTAVKVAETGSFVRAAEQLRLPVSTVSARVQALERHLRVRLFHRSTRRVRLTEAGQLFFERARAGSEAFDDAIEAATRLSERPHGLLRVVAPALFARHVLPRLLPRFLDKYPDLTLSFECTNVLPDLVECGADVGIGVGPTRWAAYVRRPLFSFSQAVYASPQFVARWGNPAKPEDLAALPLLSVGTQPTVSWALVDGSNQRSIEARARVSANDVSAVHGLALSGIGAALLPEQLCEEDLGRGTLVKLLESWGTQPLAVSAYYPRRMLEPGKVKVFLDYLKEWYAKPKGL
ncbi:MAG: LysR family transcriptional regulator [Acidobacteria bacterium]|nr:LysR family transcriptional regulator [Acidobacteriota bacterium]